MACTSVPTSDSPKCKIKTAALAREKNRTRTPEPAVAGSKFWHTTAVAH
jgi:hypothetical protein